MEAAIGIMILEVAVLEVRQVMKLMKKAIKKTCAGKDTFMLPRVSPK